MSKIDELKLLLETRDLSLVYHIGQISQHGKQPLKTKFSLEGSGVSVSQNPKAWGKIAKLGGVYYQLTKQKPNFYIADNDAEALDWCIANRYIKEATRYRVSWYDDEMEDEVSMEFDTPEEAKAEADELEVEKVTSYIFDTKGIQYWNSVFSDSVKMDNSYIDDFAPIFYAEANGYDGVWWEEELDVLKYSAPRGVIFSDKLGSWVIKQIKESDLPDDEME